jgi:hypothetical protein
MMSTDNRKLATGSSASLRLQWLYLVVIALLLSPSALPQQWDYPARLADTISKEGKLKVTAEWRDRYESRTGSGFGKDPDIRTGLVRSRLGLSYTPVKWLKVSGMVQDSRSPWYGESAPSTVRDPADLQEAYLELFPGNKPGIGLTAGRMMLTYGDGRLIGSPQWGNLSRTFDQARLFLRSKRARFDLLFVSPVKVRIGEFNRPVLGDHIWGAYSSFPDFYQKNLVDVYVLRRSQNRPGGFTGGSHAAGTDNLGITTFGFRLTGPLSSSAKYSVEAAGQTGDIGPASHRAAAWVANISRRWTVRNKPLDLLGEYKFASGTANPADTSRSGSFDQLYASNHDRFGHQDLFGWRNLHNSRFLATLGIHNAVSLNAMYSSFWLAALKDGLYGGSGKAIARSAAGTAGRHVGQEADLFATYRYKHFLFGAGGGYFVAGSFVQKTTPGVGPVYLYLFHTYSF